MTEEEIVAEKLKTVNATPETKVNSTDASLEIGNPKEFTRLYDQFGLTNPDARNGRADAAMERIWNWAKQNSIGKDKESITFEVIRLKNRLGSSGIGEVPWMKTLNYVRAWENLRNADQTMKAMETNG